MPKTILLVDDEPDFTEMVATLLGFHDYAVDTFNDPVDVEKVIARKDYDLIVCDLMMPEKNGFEVIEHLRSTEKYRKVPVIVLSAKLLTDSERKFLLRQEVTFLPKPFEPQGLVDKIKGLLR